MTDSTKIHLIADIARCHSTNRPAGIAMIFDGGETSYGELDLRANRVANGIIGEGAQPQAREGIGVLIKNRTRRRNLAPLLSNKLR